MLLEDRELRERVAKIETLLEEIEALDDPHARSKIAEVVGLLLDLHGEGFARIMDSVARSGCEDLNARFADDELVSHLLFLHGLHPLDLEARVVGALEEVRPYLHSHGGNVELLGVEGGVARLRMEGSCKGCPSSTMTLKLAIEEAIWKAAPDLESIEAEGVAAPEPSPTIVAGPTLRRKKKPEENGASPSWTVVGGLPQLSDGGTLAKEISGESILFAKLGGDFFAYRDRCPGCGGSMEAGTLNGSELTCPGCERRYGARRAGACLDEPDIHLDPVPLLVDEEVVEEQEGHSRRSIVKVALPGAVG